MRYGFCNHSNKFCSKHGCPGLDKGENVYCQVLPICDVKIVCYIDMPAEWVYCSALHIHRNIYLTYKVYHLDTYTSCFVIVLDFVQLLCVGVESEPS